MGVLLSEVFIGKIGILLCRWICAIPISQTFWKGFCLFPLYNPCHNILVPCNILLQARFVASKVNLDTQYENMSCLMSCRRTQELRKILGKCQTWVETQPSAQSSLQKQKLAIAVRNYAKADIKVFSFFFPNNLSRILVLNLFFLLSCFLQ